MAKTLTFKNTTEAAAAARVQFTKNGHAGPFLMQYRAVKSEEGVDLSGNDLVTFRSAGGELYTAYITLPETF